MIIFKEKKTILTLTIFVVFMIAVIIFGIKPLIKKAASLYIDQNKKTAELEQLKTQTKQLTDLQKTLENQQGQIDKVINYVPEKNTTDFVVQLEAVAINTKNQFKSIKFTSTAGSKTVKKTSAYLSLSNLDEQTFETQLDGNFLSLLNFLSSLENLSQANIIFSLQIKTDSGGRLTTTLKGITFTKK